MAQVFGEAVVEHGAVTLRELPFGDQTRVRVVVIPKADTKKMAFTRVRALTVGIRGNLADAIALDRANG